MNEKHTCSAFVSIGFGPRIHECGKPAKRYFIGRTSGSPAYRCGIHSRNKNIEWIEINKTEGKS